MQTLTTIPDTSTVDESATLIGTLIPALGLAQEAPDVRTLRLWRTRKILTITGRHMTRRNVLEVLVILRLRQEGATLTHAAARATALDEERLRLFLVDATPVPTARADAEAMITVQRLAQGILKQYRLVRDGAIVGHTGTHETGVANTALELHQAMARLSRHAMLEGLPDETSSVHQLLQRCMHPLGTWAPQVIRRIERYQTAVLIDPFYRVPSEDCESIVEELDASSLDDLVEHYLHEGLRTSLRRLGRDADRTYTAIREFVGRHPLATTRELQQLYLNPELNDDAIAFLRKLYEPVHASHAHGDVVRRCTSCQGLISASGCCVLSSCTEESPRPTSSSLPLDQALLALPEVLKFWVDPAREELRLYDVLRRQSALQHRVHLYPHSDWCDVSLDETIGIDVKDYRDPVRLAYRLNRSIGNLSHYPTRILAIARRRWRVPLYRERLVEQLSPERKTSLMIMSVDMAIDFVKQTAKEMA